MPKIISTSLLLVTLLILLQAVCLYLFKLPIYNYNGRLAGLFGNPNFAAGFIALSFPFSHYGLWPLYLLATLFTQSRSGLIGLLAAIIIRYPKFSFKGKIIFSAVFSLAMMLILSQTNFRYSIYENRLRIWQKGLTAFSQKPIFGWGVENFAIALKSTLTDQDYDLKNVLVDKAHNEFLEVAVSSGLIGLAIYLWLIIKSLIILKNNQDNPWAKANLISLIVFIILSQLNVLNINEYLFFYLSIATAAKLD